MAVLVLTTDSWYGPEGPNSLEHPEVFMFRTKDLTPPAFTSGHPVVSATLFTSALVAFQMDEPGTVYYAVARRDGLAAPPVDALRMHQTGTEMPQRVFVTTGELNLTAGLVTEHITVDGLTSLTKFTLWACGEDRYGNVMGEVAGRSFATLDDQSPRFLELQV